MARRPVLRGIDPQFVLAAGRKPKRGLPDPSRVRLLTDTARFPGSNPTTTDLDLARTWADKSGPHWFLKRHPELIGRFYPLNLTRLLTTAHRRREVAA